MSPVLPENFDPSRFPRKLNLGCGFDHRDGFVNIDMNSWHHPDVIADIRKLGFLPSSYYEEVLAQDVLEHLPRTETLRVLGHWNRPLAMGGKILLRVPSILGIADLLKRTSNQHPAKQEELIQCLFGTQAYTGDFHFTSFTPCLLEHYLKSAGFRTVSITLLHEWLFDVIGEKVEHLEMSPIPDFGELLGIECDEAFVDACYQKILGRTGDPAGVAFYLTSLTAASMTRQVVIDIMVGSPEFHIRHSKTSPR